MSKHKMEKIACPNCGKENDFQVWESINTVLDPDMKEKVRTREAFVFTCPECGSRTMVDYSFLYHQMEDLVMIFLDRNDNIDSTIEMMSGRGMVEDLFGEDFKEYRNRVVRSMNEFTEKLHILDAGLDDKTVEIMKELIPVQLERSKTDISYDEIRFALDRDGKKCFVFIENGNAIGSMELNEKLYQLIQRDFGTLIDADENVLIDSKWAAQFMKETD